MFEELSCDNKLALLDVAQILNSIWVKTGNMEILRARAIIDNMVDISEILADIRQEAIKEDYEFSEMLKFETNLFKPTKEEVL